MQSLLHRVFDDSVSILSIFLYFVFVLFCFLVFCFLLTLFHDEPEEERVGSVVDVTEGSKGMCVCGSMFNCMYANVCCFCIS